MKTMRRPDPIGEMEFDYYAVDLPCTLKMVKIAPTSDVHYGNPYCSLRHFRQHIQYIASDPEMYTVLNGDLLECVIKNSKGEIYKQIGTPQDQRDFIINELTPIKHKILCMTTGNHESRIYQDTGVDLSLDIAKALGIPYRPEGMMLKISFGGGNSRHPENPYVYWFYMTHGYGGARTKSAKAVKAERLAAWIHADCYLMSHDHVVSVAPDVYLLPDNRTRDEYIKGVKTGFKVGKLKAHRKMLVKCNAFVKWGGYAEAGGFPPSDLAVPLIKLDGGGAKRVRVEV